MGSTVEVTFNGAFCPNINFVRDYEGNNVIIKDIEDCEANKYLVDKCELRAGYKIFKIKGSSVLNKPFVDSWQVLEKSEKDTRVSYQVVFIEGKLDWYNFSDPNTYKNDEEKVDMPRRKKSGRRTPRTSIGSPTTPTTPRSSAKNPK